MVPVAKEQSSLFSSRRITVQNPRPFLLIYNRSVTNIDPTRVLKSDFWPAEEMIARGYAAAAFFNGDVAADNARRFVTGVRLSADPWQWRSDPNKISEIEHFNK